jgi:acetyl-CoA C-acetyltransferase
MAEAYIGGATRLAGGRRGGRLSGVHPVTLAAHVLDALVKQTAIAPGAIEDVVMGCVTQVGDQSVNFGRNVVLASSLPDSVPAVTIDRQCGSSQQALHFAAQAVMSGVHDVVIAAGAENMSRAPIGAAHRLAKEAGMGTGPITDAIRRRFGVSGFSQFTSAQMLADKYGLSRLAMDQYALDSHRKAAKASAEGAFAAEITAIEVTLEDGSVIDHRTDEGIRADASIEGLAGLKPLEEGGAITAGNTSQICDAASAILVVSEQALKDHGLTPLARIHAMTVTAGDPVLMIEEPIHASRRVLKRAGLSIGDIGLYEVNEAFSSVPLAWAAAMGADPERLNVHGGAIALGHPLGASGARIATTLVHALHRRGERYGLQTMCEGGGLSNATIIERL